MGKKGKPGQYFRGDSTIGFTANSMRAQIANIGAKPTGAVRRVATDQSAAIDNFGGSLSMSVKKQFLSARAAAQAQAAVTTAGKDQLAAGVGTIKDIASIGKSGAQAQAAAFAYAKAMQMQEQTNASDSQTAAFMQQLMTMKLQRTWAAQDAAKAAAQARRDLEAPYKAQAAALETTAPTVTARVAELVNAAIKENGGTYDGINILDLQAEVLGAGGWSQESGEGALAASMVQQMVNGRMSASKAVPLALTSAFGGLPGADRWLPQTARAIDTSYLDTRFQRYLDNKDDPGDDDVVVDPTVSRSLVNNPAPVPFSV